MSVVQGITHLLASYKTCGTGVGPSRTTFVTRFITVDGLSTSTRTNPERSARVDPVTGGFGCVAFAVAVNALTWYKGMRGEPGHAQDENMLI